MGYACPVCDVPQVDGRHLANHVAFSALTGDGDHEAWLDAHVPEWSDLGENELAAEVVPLATETDVADAFDDEGSAPPAVDRQRVPAPDLDDEAASILSDAQEYTRRMADDGNEDGDGGADGGTDGDEIDGAGEGNGSDERDEGEDGADSRSTADETE